MSALTAVAALVRMNVRREGTASDLSSEFVCVVVIASHFSARKTYVAIT